MKTYRIQIGSGGWWRNFSDGSIREFTSRQEAEQIIRNWMIDGDTTRQEAEQIIRDWMIDGEVVVVEA